MRLSLKFIGELQYGLGIAIILLVLAGIFFIYPSELDKTRREISNNWASSEDYYKGEGFVFENRSVEDKYTYHLIMMSSVQDIKYNITLFKLEITAILIGLFGLGIFIILQGIANIKISRQKPL